MVLMRDTYNGGRWTKGRWNSFVTSTLRAGSRRWPPKFDTLNAARTEKKINPKSGRLAQHYLCNECKHEFVATQVQVDHIKAMGAGCSWDDFVNGLFCEADNLQVLCLACHKEKTSKEKKERKK